MMNLTLKAQTYQDVWRQLSTGKVAAQSTLIEIICRVSHGVDHYTRWETREKQKHWFVPKLTEHVTNMILQCQICQEANTKKSVLVMLCLCDAHLWTYRVSK